MGTGHVLLRVDGERRAVLAGVNGAAVVVVGDRGVQRLAEILAQCVTDRAEAEPVGQSTAVGGQMDGSCHSPPDRCPPSCTATGSAPTLPGVTADRQARVEDVHELALGLPHVTVVHGSRGNAVYQVGGRSFVFFRTPRPDAVDATTGERLPDVIVFWVESEADKQALVQDGTTPFFTTPHFDGHNSVLVQASRLGGITRQELAELVQDAWLAQASARRRTAWLAEHGATD